MKIVALVVKGHNYCRACTLFNYLEIIEMSFWKGLKHGVSCFMAGFQVYSIKRRNFINTVVILARPDTQHSLQFRVEYFSMFFAVINVIQSNVLYCLSYQNGLSSISQ